MKKNVLGILFFFLAVSFSCFSQDKVTVSGRKILLNGSLYQIKGVCYAPHAVGAPEWIPDWSKVSQDISMMKAACINTIRTYRPIQDKGVLDAFANAGIRIIIGFTLEETRNGTYANYINTYKNHPAILMWVHGNEFNYHPDWFSNNLNNWYSTLNAAAGNTKSLDPNHPVATVHGELPPQDAINACPNIEVWGMNIYRQNNVGPLFTDWAARSGKPMFIAESGSDSYPDVNAPAVSVTSIWTSVNNNGTWKSSNSICSGITFFSWTDEWWKSGDDWNQNTGGFPNIGVTPDGFANEEYWGILDIYRNPKPAYNSLKTAYCSGINNLPPNVAISTPSNNSSFTAGSAITISANASDSDGSVTKVEFFNGSTKLGEDATSPYSFSWNNVAAGIYVLTAKATDNLSAISTSSEVTITVNGIVTQSPYGGTAASIPGRIEAERYDLGGSTVAFYDGTAGNTGTQFRNDNVDIESNSDGGPGYNVGWTEAGEWLEYTVNVSTAGKYDFKARVASSLPGKSFHIELNGVNVTGAIAVPNTGGWQNWQTVTVTGVTLNAGTQILRVYMDTDGFNLNYVDVSAVVINNNPPSVSLTAPTANSTYSAPASVTIAANASDSDGIVSKVEFYQGTNKLGEDVSAPYSFLWSNIPAGTYQLTAKAIDNAGATGTSSLVTITVVTSDLQSPFGGSPISIPGRVEAESYDLGGSAIAYYDGSAGNTGAQFRTDNVDIESNSDGGPGYNVGWTAAGEWLEFTVNVSAAGKYDFKARVAAASAGKSFHIEMNGTNVSGAIVVPNTGGWQIWQTVTVSGISLNAGTQVMRIFMDTDGFNLNYVDVTSGTISTNTAPSVTLTSPSANSSYTAPGSIFISANASDADGSIAKVEFYQGSSKLGEDASSPYTFTWSNVAAGTYVISARAIDNLNAVGNSSSVNVTVNGTTNNTTCNGSLANGDYSYEVASTSSTSTIKFIPGAAIAGTNMVLLYYKIGTGGYMGTFMDLSGSNYTKSIAVPVNSQVTFYFTYRVGTTTAERNSSATPHTFTAGQCGSTARVGAADVSSEETISAFGDILSFYPNPTISEFTISLSSSQEESVEVEILDFLSNSKLNLDEKLKVGMNTIQVNVEDLESGIYFVVIKAGKKVRVQKIVVTK
jgi:hypothetical protein